MSIARAAKPADGEQFAAEVKEICELYEAAQKLAENGAEVVSVDEKTGIQVLERAAATLPMRAGEAEKQESEYIRHGTQCLIGNLKIATGEMVAPAYRGNQKRGRFCETHGANAQN